MVAHNKQLIMDTRTACDVIRSGVVNSDDLADTESDNQQNSTEENSESDFQCAYYIDLGRLGYYP